VKEYGDGVGWLVKNGFTILYRNFSEIFLVRMGLKKILQFKDFSSDNSGKCSPFFPTGDYQDQIVIFIIYPV